MASLVGSTAATIGGTTGRIAGATDGSDLVAGGIDCCAGRRSGHTAAGIAQIVMPHVKMPATDVQCLTEECAKQRGSRP